MINYFGKYDNIENIEVSPILLKKGETRLALYGLSHIRDERLGRLFRDGKVCFNKLPDENWFNLLVLHQNRAERGRKNFIPEKSLPPFLQLVVWGHEHDCRIDPELLDTGVYISQPGSSVATSLSQGEMLEKKVGLLKICGTRMKMKSIPLKSVRPFVYEEMILDKPDSENFEEIDPKQQTEECLDRKMKNILDKIKQDLRGM